MIKKNYADIEALHVDNEVAKKIAGRVLIGRADGAANFCMRLFEMGQGGHTPKHSHDWEHEIFVVSGDGEVLGNGSWQPFRAGDTVFVTPGEEHQIRNNGTELLRFICVVPSGAPEL